MCTQDAKKSKLLLHILASSYVVHLAEFRQILFELQDNPQQKQKT